MTVWPRCELALALAQEWRWRGDEVAGRACVSSSLPRDLMEEDGREAFFYHAYEVMPRDELYELGSRCPLKRPGRPELFLEGVLTGGALLAHLSGAAPPLLAGLRELIAAATTCG